MPIVINYDAIPAALGTAAEVGQTQLAQHRFQNYLAGQEADLRERAFQRQLDEDRQRESERRFGNLLAAERLRELSRQHDLTAQELKDRIEAEFQRQKNDIQARAGRQISDLQARAIRQRIQNEFLGGELTTRIGAETEKYLTTEVGKTGRAEMRITSQENIANQRHEDNLARIKALKDRADEILKMRQQQTIRTPDPKFNRESIARRDLANYAHTAYQRGQWRLDPRDPEKAKELEDLRIKSETATNDYLDYVKNYVPPAPMPKYQQPTPPSPSTGPLDTGPGGTEPVSALPFTMEELAYTSQKHGVDPLLLYKAILAKGSYAT